MKLRWIDKYGMLLEGERDDQGRGDALWRTSLAWIAYPENTALAYGIALCFKGTRPVRHPESTRKDCSRDQVIMANVALHLNDHEMISDVPYRLSDAFTMADAWLWYRGLRDHNRWLLLLWRIVSFFMVWWMPMYAIHIWSWMVYCLHRPTPVLNVIGRLLAGRKNILLRMLHGAHVKDRELYYVIPRKGFQWQWVPRKLPPGVTIDPISWDEPYKVDVDVLKRMRKICQL